MAQFKLLRHDAIIDLGYSCTQCVLEQHKKLKTLKNVKPSNFLQLTKIFKSSHVDFWDQTREYQIRNRVQCLCGCT